MTKIRIENEYLGNSRDGEWAYNEYKSVIRYKTKQMTVPSFKMGMGLTGEPSEGDIISSLLMDYQSAESARDFEDFANEFGYDPDSRKAEKIYKSCIKNAEKLKNLLGEDLPVFMKKYENY